MKREKRFLKNITLKSKLLHNKTALITGCNRGIGKAIVETFAKNGANIWACARQSSPEFLDFLSNIEEKYNIKTNPLFFDLAKENEIKESLSGLINNKSCVDILVNNAGVAHGGLLQMTSIKKIREVFEINFFAQLLIIQQISKLMMRQKNGRIINLVSVAAMDSLPGYCAYGTSKAAFIYLTKTLSKEMAPYNIQVNAIAPGLTETGMADQMEEKAKNMMVEECAMKRLAQPQEVANVALFLASDLSSFMNGQIIRVDGGV